MSATAVYEDQPASFYLLPFRAWELLLGTMLHLIARRKSPPQKWQAECLATLGLVLIAAAVFCYSDRSRFPGIAALLPCVGAALVVAAPTSVAGALLSTRPMVYIGKISYSLYLWHWPVIVLARYYLDREFSSVETIIVCFAAFGLSWLTWLFVEQPIRRKRTWVPPYGILTASIAVCAMVGAGAYWIASAEGLPSRLSPLALSFEAARNDWSADQFDCVDRTADSVRGGDMCLFGHADSGIEVLLWGDSHSTAILPAMQQIAADNGWSLTFVGTNGCPPVLGVETKGNCASVNAATADVIGQRGFDAVVLAAAWTSYGRSNAVYVAGDSVTGTDPRLIEQFTTTLEAVESSGARALLFGQVPSYAVNIPNFLAKSEFLSKFDRAIGFGRSATATDEPATGFFGMVAAEANIPVLKPADYLCDADKCALSSNGVAIYKDGGHLSQQGSLLLMPVLRSFVVSALELPASPNLAP